MGSADQIIVNKRALAQPSDIRGQLNTLTLSERAIAVVLDRALDRIRVLEAKLMERDQE